MDLASWPVRAVALFVSGVLLFADASGVAAIGFFATVAILIAIGFVDGRLRALSWAAMLVASAFAADVLWQLDWEPFNRSHDYEAIPQTPFVLIGLPIPMALIGLGLGAGALWRRIRSEPTQS